MLPAAIDAMRPWVELECGNPSSLHENGRRAKAAMDEAREVLADSLGCLFAEVLFTSSGTEAANLAILGSALANLEGGRRRILMSAVEHHCVLHTEPILRKLGFKVDLIPVDREGAVDLNALDDLLGDDVLLLSLMHANNEMGVWQPISEAFSMARGHGVLIHCDSVQSYLSKDLSEVEADLITLSAHKVNGPKGAGAIHIRAGIKLQPIQVGGGQEREMRAGTEDVAAIAGFGAAVRAHRKDPSLMGGKRALRDAFLDALNGSDAALTIADRHRILEGHAHLRFPGFDAETLLIALDQAGISASSGSACSSGSLEPSHVLSACGYSPAEAKEGLRFTFGWPLTPEVAKEAAHRLLDVVARIEATRASRR